MQASKKIDSLLNYIGHKSKIIKTILPYFPESLDGTFWDVFAGSCVVGLSVSYDNIVCSDINPHLISLYDQLNRNPENVARQRDELIKRYNLTNSSVTPRSEYLKDPRIGTVTWHGETVSNFHLDQLNKPGFLQMLTDFNTGELNECCAAYLLLNLYGRNSSVNVDSRGQLSGSVGPLDYSKRAHEKFKEHVEVMSEGRHSFMCASYDTCEPGPNDFVYLDPPYLASGYRYSGWSEDDERALLSWIDRLPCAWALSNTLQSGNRQNKILINWAADKMVIPIEKRYRKWAGSGQSSAERSSKINEEVLILSYKSQSLFEW